MDTTEKYNLTSKENYSICRNCDTAATLTVSDYDLTSNNKLLSL